MTKSSSKELFDTIVIGSGIAGLTAALRLQRQGQRVLVIERRSTAGGLCGTMNFDGYEFALACNDFGCRTQREMAALGVPIAFHTRASRFFNESGYLQLPPDLRSALKLLGQAPSILRVLRAIRSTSGSEYLGSLLERHRVPILLRDLIGIAAYGLGTPLSALPVETLVSAFSKKWNYGYDRATSPHGGPGMLIARMVQRLEENGGTLLLGTDCSLIEGAGAQHHVVTTNGDFIARAVISSEGRWNEYPKESRASLSVSMLLLALPHSLHLPPGIHTLGYFPTGCAEWMEQLESGERPARFGFHLFRCDLPARPDHYTANIYFFLPRGWEDPDDARMRWAEGFILEHVERLVPGLGKAALYKRFLSPRAFGLHTGMSSVVVPKMLPAGFKKPDSYDAIRDIHFVGNSVYPPGEHAAGAVLSGLLAAEKILASTFKA